MNNVNNIVKNIFEKKITNNIVSYGVILIKFNYDKHKYNFLKNIKNLTANKKIHIYEHNNIEKNNIDNIDNIYNIDNKYVEYLIIRRKYTIAYTCIIRGKYNEKNIRQIETMFKQMSKYEINLIKILNNFDLLWSNFWSKYNISHRLHYLEYEISKYKFYKCKQTIEHIIYNIDNKNEMGWISPEWEFPKGRKKIKERNLCCAMREFEEETGFNDNDYTIIKNIAPIYENFIGLNKKKYTYIYYIAISTSNKKPKLNEMDINQIKEIGDIGYYNYCDILKKIRFYHKRKINNIKNLNEFIVNLTIKKSCV
jgi:8-oxo-dGTP pyrophosphatase MutT (NUDIX family)